jgi:hypothetical protein
MAQSEIKREERNKKVTKENDEISKRIWEGILDGCQQNQKKRSDIGGRILQGQRQKYGCSCGRINSETLPHFYMPEVH